jgi:S1-C subfamily serine protease
MTPEINVGGIEMKGRGMITGTRWILAVFILGSLSGLLSAPTSAQERTARRTQIILVKPGAAIGIDEMEGDMVYRLTQEGLILSFKSEPRIRKVDPRGPSAGRLERGDVIVALGGRLITTRQAGIDFTHMVAGEPVKLVIRRGGRVRSVHITPVALAAKDTLQTHLPFDLESGFTENLMDTIMARIQAEFTSWGSDLPVGFEGVGPSPDHTLLGMVLRLDGSSLQDKDGTRTWRFHKPPLIISVEPGGPADVGGLLPGDLLTHIDGVRMDRAAGGKVFSSIHPGQKIVWTVTRGRERLKIETTATPPPH